jgi:thymidylate synthase (FAD)
LNTKLIWTTPEGDNLLGYIARVSNTSAKREDAADRLIKYLIEHRHWSPFEMVNACVYIECPRDISRQILRHRSFSFQEFSGRYAAYDDLDASREVRLQDHENRQNSFPVGDEELRKKWEGLVWLVRGVCLTAYRTALDWGVAKEVARVLLPEGLVPTRLYVNGTLRSWIHYWSVRCSPDTQKEHREIAEQTRELILAEYPGIREALGG